MEAVVVVMVVVVMVVVVVVMVGTVVSPCFDTGSGAGSLKVGV